MVGHLLGIFTLQIRDMANSHGIKITDNLCSYSNDWRSPGNTKAIKAALKLCACMHYFIYASHLRTCLVLKTQHCLPHLKHPIQLVHSLVETLRPEVGQKR